jgi:hypothetical protein
MRSMPGCSTTSECTEPQQQNLNHLTFKAWRVPLSAHGGFAVFQTRTGCACSPSLARQQ